MPAPVARQLHAEVAAFLQQHQGEPARLALHWVQAAAVAPAGSAFMAAAERSRRTSSLTEQSVLLAEAASCFERAGRPAERFEALLQRARALTSNDLGADATSAVEAVEQAAAGDEQRLLALAARLELALIRYELHDSLRLGEQAIETARLLGRSDLELRFAITLSGALCDARRADEAVALLAPHAAWVRSHAEVEQQWEYWAATALALDYADRLGDAMPAWEAARAVAQQAERRDMIWKTMSNGASTQAKMGLVAEAAQRAEQAHRLARAANEAGDPARAADAGDACASAARRRPLCPGAGLARGGARRLRARAARRIPTTRSPSSAWSCSTSSSASPARRCTCWRRSGRA